MTDPTEARVATKKRETKETSVLVDVVAAAGQVVVMSQSARDRLCGSFDVDPAKVGWKLIAKVDTRPKDKDAVAAKPSRQPFANS